MSSANANSVKNTATTSRSEPPANLNEAAFLYRQGDDAKAAIGQTLKVMQDDLKEAIDVKAWTQQYPWAAVGAAALAGFAVVSTLTPRPGENWSNRLGDLFPEGISGTSSPTYGPTADFGAAPTGGGGFLAGLTGTLLDTLKTTVQSAVVAAVTAKTHQETQASQEHTAEKEAAAAAGN